MTAEHDAITRALDEADAWHLLDNSQRVRARSQLDALLAENARLHRRLEDSHVFQSNAAGELVEVAVEPGSIPDGIDCRDTTIRQIEEILEQRNAENARLREALSDVVNACGNDGERIKDDEFFKVMDRIASAHAKARALLAPEEKTDGE